MEPAGGVPQPGVGAAARAQVRVVLGREGREGGRELHEERVVENGGTAAVVRRRRLAVVPLVRHSQQQGAPLRLAVARGRPRFSILPSRRHGDESSRNGTATDGENKKKSAQLD